MSLKSFFSDSKNTKPLRGTLLALLTLITLPQAQTQLAIFLSFSCLIFLLLYSCSLWCFKSFSSIIFNMSLVSSLILGINSSYWYTFVVLVIMNIYMKRKFAVHTVIVFVMISLIGSNTFAQNKKLTYSQIPDHLKGLPLNKIGNCGSIDQIPWKSKDKSRQSRFLIKDEFTLATDTKARNWEIHQVLNDESISTFIFKTKNDKGIKEYWAFQGDSFKKFINEGGKKKVIERKSYKKFIDRPVITFLHKSSSKITYKPQAAGRSTLEIQLVSSSGGYIPPFYISGVFCNRPATLEINDSQSDINKSVSSGSAPGTPAAK